ncbi:hypothetical protein H6P81_001174 [Aristolochia fimbriata]|uniref:Uncharacterized protein n=1 Tax=Aristolochia fimbriata TaxID=158543 RepID=A0AAV7F7E4_ARIFI|nr:hypothetical protein H6P81_001174 [Aristolochia fimbriata]
MHRPNPAILGCPFCAVHVHHYHACPGASEEKPVVLMPCGYCLAYRRSLVNMLLDNFMTFPECACSVCHCPMDPGVLNAVLHPLQGNDFIHAGIRNFFRNRQQPAAANTGAGAGAGSSSTGNGQPSVPPAAAQPTQVVDVDTPPTIDPPIVIDVDPPTEDEADPAAPAGVNVDQPPPRRGTSTSAPGRTPRERSRRKASVPRRFLQRPPPPSNPKKMKRICSVQDSSWSGVGGRINCGGRSDVGVLGLYGLRFFLGNYFKVGMNGKRRDQTIRKRHERQNVIETYGSKKMTPMVTTTNRAKNSNNGNNSNDNNRNNDKRETTATTAIRAKALTALMSTTTTILTTMTTTVLPATTMMAITTMPFLRQL